MVQEFKERAHWLAPVLGAVISIVSALIIVAASYGALEERVENHVTAPDRHSTYLQDSERFVPRTEIEQSLQNIDRRLKNIENSLKGSHYQ